MKTFKQHLAEGNPLAKLHKTIESGSSFGTISPETSETNNRKKKSSAHSNLQKDLTDLRKAGMINYTGPHKGLYKYADPDLATGDSGIAKEGSYLLTPGSHPDAESEFHGHIKALGTKHGQESVLIGKKGSEGKTTGSLHYTRGEKLGTSEEIGKIHLNAPFENGSGQTRFKNKVASFTFK